MPQPKSLEGHLGEVVKTNKKTQFRALGSRELRARRRDAQSTRDWQSLHHRSTITHGDIDRQLELGARRAQVGEGSGVAVELVV